MHQCAYLFALDYLLQITQNIHVEHIDGQVILHAHGSGSDIHHLQTALDDLLIGDVVELGGWL